MPALKVPPSFPGLGSLPSPIKGLAEWAFPQDDPSQVMIAPGMAAQEKIGPGLQVIKKGGLDLAGKGADAVKALLSILHKPLPEVDPLAHVAGSGVTGFRVPKASTMNIPEGFSLPFEFDPKAAHYQPDRKPGFTHQITSQKGRDPNLRQLEKQQKDYYSGAGLTKVHKPTADVPAAKGLADLGNVTSKPTPSSTRPPLSGRYQSGPTSAATKRTGTKVNPDIVKEMRGMAEKGHPLAVIASKYPELDKATVHAIVKRESWNWVK